jgi:tRNA(Ile)-lysidine synthase
VQLDTQSVERFRRDLDGLIEPAARLGIAVSGGPDSLALLCLAASARPGLIEAATVDHALRPESRGEAEMVAAVCERLDIPHRILTVQWPAKPKTALQEQARMHRYRLLGDWARERQLAALVAAHHLDDQAETFVMRLARGAGLKGLAGMRRFARTPDGSLPLLRPLLGWSHAELESICASAGLDPAIDPSNADEQFERVRIRGALAGADWLPGEAIARSAANLTEADAAVHWAATQAWQQSVHEADDGITFAPDGIPREIRRRIVRRAVLALASEGDRAELRGRELDAVLAAFASGKKATLRGVLCSGGKQWRFAKAPARRRGR